MSGWLTCDDVFDRLTRGPFPTNEPGDAEIELHLAACHECRALAEALRPAVRLLNEVCTPGPTSGADLPVYWGPSAPPRYPAATRPTRSPSQLHETPWGWQLAAAALLGAVLGAAAAGGWFTRHVAGAGPGFGPSDQLASLHAFTLHDACLKQEGAAGARSVRCCNHCHNAQQMHRQPIDMARLQLACTICHTR